MTAAPPEAPGGRLRIGYWLRSLGEFAGAQAVSQILGLAAALIFVRVMMPEDYALFAVAMTALSIVTVGSDFGLSAALAHFWRESHGASETFAQKLYAILRTRRVFFAIAAIAAVIYLMLSPVLSGAGVMVRMSVAGLVLALGFLYVRNAMNAALWRLEGHQRRAYAADLVGSAARLSGALIMLLSAASAASLALGAALLGAAASALVLGQQDRKLSGGHGAPAEYAQADVRRYILPMAPMVIVFIIQDPLVVWLTAEAAGPQVVAEVFALNRIAALFVIPAMIVSAVFVPHLARIPGSGALFASFLRMLALIALGGGAVLGVFAFMPFVPLYLIGPAYAHLEAEIILVAATALIGVVQAFCVHVNRLRGWVRLDPVFALVHVGLLVAITLNWSYAVTMSVLVLNFTLACLSLSLALVVLGLGLLRPDLMRTKISRGSADDTLSAKLE